MSASFRSWSEIGCAVVARDRFCNNENDTDTAMTADNASLEAKLRLRAYYLWEADGRPEGRLGEYWPKAQAMLDDEAKIAVPADEATAAGALLTKPLHDRR
jgi:hypothetical protein